MQSCHSVYSHHLNNCLSNPMFLSRSILRLMTPWVKLFFLSEFRSYFLIHNRYWQEHRAELANAKENNATLL